MTGKTAAYMQNLLEAARCHKRDCAREDYNVSLIMLKHTADFIFNSTSFRSTKALDEAQAIMDQFKEIY
jgi:hypothetical protein